MSITRPEKKKWACPALSGALRGDSPVNHQCEQHPTAFVRINRSHLDKFEINCLLDIEQRIISPVESDLLLASWRTVIKNAIFVRGKSLAFRIFHAQISHGCWSIVGVAFFSIPLLYFLFFLSFLLFKNSSSSSSLFSVQFPSVVSMARTQGHS